jgi:beta-lactamase class A
MPALFALVTCPNCGYRAPLILKENFVIRRRDLGLWGGTGLALGLLVPVLSKAAVDQPIGASVAAHAAARLKALERACGGRLGVFMRDTGTGAEWGQRSDERFSMCSTFKMLATALVLRRADLGQESLDRRITFGKQDLVPWSPVTERHAAGGGMTLAALCEATMTTSDNTAANLIVHSFGGPAALTAFAREIGDDVTRLDRIEPQLNDWQAGDERDTTSPRAMLHSLQQVTLGPVLSAPSRERLLVWLRASTTGSERLRAGLPAPFVVANKTGSSRVASNDIAVVWPSPSAAPWLVCAYLEAGRASTTRRNATVAQVGGLLRDLATRS